MLTESRVEARDRIAPLGDPGLGVLGPVKGRESEGENGGECYQLRSGSVLPGRVGLLGCLLSGRSFRRRVTNHPAEKRQLSGDYLICKHRNNSDTNCSQQLLPQRYPLAII